MVANAVVLIHFKEGQCGSVSVFQDFGRMRLALVGLPSGWGTVTFVSVTEYPVSGVGQDT